MSLLDIDIKSALEDPFKFYHNDLLNMDDVITIDELPYSSVCAFLYLNLDSSQSAFKTYISKYEDKISEECKRVKKKDIRVADLSSCCPYLKPYIYSEEWSNINVCKTESDYRDYLSKFGGVCKEYDLFAEFQLSLIEGTTFAHYNDVIQSFPYSKLFDIEDLKSRCEEFNGLFILWSVSVTDIHKKIIRSILASLRHDELLDSYVSDEFVTKEQWYAVLESEPIDFINRFCPAPSSPILCNFNEAKSFIARLCEFTNLSWSLPFPTVRMDLEKVEQFTPIRCEWCILDRNSMSSPCLVRNEREIISKGNISALAATFRLMVNK